MKNIFLLAFLLYLLTGCDNKVENKTTSITQTTPTKPNYTKQIKDIEAELSVIDSDTYLEKYVLKVINEGSDGKLGFPDGAMDAGYADKRDAPDIARYVLTLSGKKSSDDKKAKKSELFFTSNCGGCHGHDGKGLSGAYPDLTLQTLQGVKERKKCLTRKLRTLKSSLE